jgi:cob(I)alamin adenosyltransferase
MKGLIHIYTGNGKGKTTAAIGLGIRAHGRGFKVLMVQFLKGADTGEMFILKSLEPGFTLHRGTEIRKFTWDMSKDELQQTREMQENIFKYAMDSAICGDWDMIILDEVMGAITAGMLDLNAVVGLIKQKPDKLELVLTGRNAPAELVELSDYVSDIHAVKHPMEKGIGARKGIEN